MKIHRLIIIDRIKDSHQIGVSENCTDLSDAIHGLEDWPTVRDQLLHREVVRREFVVAGIRTRITLTPSTAPSRATVLRQKQECNFKGVEGI